MPDGERIAVAVVGGGAAGLSTAAALGRVGVHATVLEREPDIGASWANRYDGLHLHTVRRFSGLAYHGIPRRYGRYVAKDHYAAYLRDYRERFRLDVRTGVDVSRIAVGTHGTWRLEAGERTFAADAVVVATGSYGVPRRPSWPGVDEYGGELLHSSEFRSARDFAGRRVLVVGAGNSGTEIAVALTYHAVAPVSIAIRTPPPVTQRELFGVPVQLLGLALSPAPPAVGDGIGRQLRRLANRDLFRLGLAEEAWSPFASRRPPVIDASGFADAVRRGGVVIRPAVTALTADGAVFADGREEPADAVVAAIGFETGLARMLDVPNALDARGLPRNGVRPGLYFVGFHETIRGHLYEANRESRRVAKSIAAYFRARGISPMRDGAPTEATAATPT